MYGMGQLEVREWETRQDRNRNGNGKWEQELVQKDTRAEMIQNSQLSSTGGSITQSTQFIVSEKPIFNV